MAERTTHTLRRYIMTNLKTLFLRLATEDSGQDLIEYALVAALISLAAIAGLKTVGNQVSALMSSVGSNLTSVNG
jgi:pilus assembly protein Flp/PilA